MEMSEDGASGAADFGHLVGLGLDLAACAGSDGRPVEVVRVAPLEPGREGRGLLVALGDGRVCLFAGWGGSPGLLATGSGAAGASRARAAAPAAAGTLRHVWQLPPGAGGATALVAAPAGAFGAAGFSGEGGGHAAVDGYVGTGTGSILCLSPQSSEAAALAAGHAPHAVTTMALHTFMGSLAAGPRRVLLSADAAGRVMRLWLRAASSTSEQEPACEEAELLADLRAPVLSFDFCERTGRLLVSTAERIAVLDGALAAGRPELRFVGTKPHKGQLTAAFSSNFGSEALISSRPGGRLWVAEGSTGTVQTTLKFQRTGTEDKVSLGRLLTVRGGKALSWTRAEPGDAAADAVVVLLDLEAIAVCREWAVVPVVDAARWGPDRVVLAHPSSLSVLLLLDRPLEVLRGCLADAGLLLCRSRDFLAERLQLAGALKERLAAACSASQLLAELGDLVEAVQVFDDAKDGGHGFAAEFKRWVLELEDAASAEAAAGCGAGAAPSLSQASLANFPVAEELSAAVVPELPPVQVHLQPSDVPASVERFFSAEQDFATLPPEALLRPTAPAAAAAAGAGTAVAPPAQGAGQVAAAWRVPEGAVLRELAARPFVGGEAGRRLLREALPALAAVLRAAGAATGSATASSVPRLPASVCRAGPPDATGLLAVAGTVFELLCLHAAGCDAEGRAAWPRLSFAWAAGGEAQAAAEQEPSAGALADVLQDLGAFEEGAARDLWARCAAAWTPAVAFGFCSAFLGGCGGGCHSTLERCWLRVNGLAATCAGWRAVGARLQRLLPAAGAAAEATSDGGRWDAALEQLSSLAHGADDAEGFANLHGFLAAALRSSPPLRGTETPADAAWRLRRTFTLALESFPKVLPWNVELWSRCSLHELSFGSVEGRSVEQLELLGRELGQYLLQLLPTCCGAQDFSQLLEGTASVLLHRHCLGDGSLWLRLAGNAAVDRFIHRFQSSLAPDLFDRLAYPPGIVLLAKLSGHSLDGDMAASLVDRQLQLLKDCCTRPPRGPAAALAGSQSQRCQGAPLGGVEAAAPCVPQQVRDRPLVEHFPCLLPSDLELAHRLRELAGEGQGWSRLLDAVVEALREAAAASATAAPGSSCRSGCMPTPLESLLAALVQLAPGPDTAAVCLRALRLGVFSGPAAASAVNALWGEAASRPGGGLAASEGAVAWLPLPPQRPPLPLPVPESPHEDAASSEGSAADNEEGFSRCRRGDLVDVSDDGLVARHLDDTGELLCGVLLSARPLVASRLGLYFEVELLEARREDCFDGLTLGVTAACPADLVSDPPTVEHIPQTWAVGYDGQMWDAATELLCRVDWDPRSLEVGDSIGVLVTASEGELLIFHNGVACCPGPRGIPVASTPLYAVVDLLGHARSVRWRVGATAPVE